MWELFVTFVVGPLVGFLGHKYLGERRWKQVRDTATQILVDPKKTNDPQAAVTEALIQHELDRLVREAEKVQEAFTPRPL